MINKALKRNFGGNKLAYSRLEGGLKKLCILREPQPQPGWVLAGSDTFADGYKPFNLTVPAGVALKIRRVTPGQWVTWKINDITGWEWTLYEGTEVILPVTGTYWTARCYYYYSVPIEINLYYWGTVYN
jgi:hypothetical protein